MPRAAISNEAPVGEVETERHVMSVDEVGGVMLRRSRMINKASDTSPTGSGENYGVGRQMGKIAPCGVHRHTKGPLSADGSRSNDHQPTTNIR